MPYALLGAPCRALRRPERDDTGLVDVLAVAAVPRAERERYVSALRESTAELSR